MNNPQLTCLTVKHDLILELLAPLQGIVDADDDIFTGLGAVEELTRATLLHDFRPGEARELTEAIRTVDDGEAFGHLSVGQNEITVWRMKRNGSGVT